MHVKNYLTAGKMANIYRSQNGQQKKMHVFLTPDMMEVICKRPNRQQVKFHWRMHIKDIEDIKVYTNHKAQEFTSSGFGKYKNIFRSAPNVSKCVTLVGPADFKGRV